MTDTSGTPKKTPFYQHHVDAGAKMVEFAGYIMPIQYKNGMQAEHKAVRENVGLFDLSHMGEFEVSGPGATAFLQKTTVNNVEKLDPGQIQYSCMTKPDGGIVDDLLIYRLPDRYMLVVNASNIDKDLAWLESNLTSDAKLINRSDDTGLLAIQGPNAQKVLAMITDHDLDNMPYYTWTIAEVGTVELLFSRTGYTGEDGFELYIHPDHCDKVWNAVSDAGGSHGMELIGLGARDTLRLEMKMALYGNDIDETTNPVEAGLSWIVDFDKDFIGSDVVKKVKADKPTRRLVCLEMEGRVFPRQGYKVFVDDTEAGHITSGTFSPSLQKPIAMAYVPQSHFKSGNVVQVDIRGKKIDATVVKPPFYKNASHK